MDLEGKIALVTGAGQGIGKGCALELARSGADVVLNDLPGSTAAATTAEEIRALGRACTVIEADVFSRTDRENLVDRALKIDGRIDILVSNPARSIREGFLDQDADVFEQVVSGTLVSSFHLSQLVARHMVQRKAGGKIVFISSVHAHSPYANSVAYNAAKAGLNHMARTIATELTQHRINVNVIEPGWIDTPGELALFGKETILREGKKLPWGRMGAPEEIGAAVAFLASDRADYITGVVLPVDGCFRFKDCRMGSLAELKE
ncbi:MAG: SDR family oxidoreductase [Planctomycetes bacterium]|nr:SDR family oxidoreductase [Planctomycetota bacterium]